MYYIIHIFSFDYSLPKASLISWIAFACWKEMKGEFFESEPRIDCQPLWDGFYFEVWSIYLEITDLYLLLKGIQVFDPVFMLLHVS